MTIDPRAISTPPTRHLAASLLKCRKGANAVEFAIICPLFFMLMAGILVYGLYFGTAHAVQQLAADAARASIAGLSDAERVRIAEAHVQTSIDGYPFISPDRLTVTAHRSPNDNDLFVVNLVYDASELPVFGLDSLIPVPSSTIQRSSAIRRGGY